MGRSYERRSGTRRGSARPSRRVAKDGHVLTGVQGLNLTGITFPDNQTRSWLTIQNNQTVVLTGIQYHFGPGAETGPDRPSRALEPSDRHLHTPKQPFNFKYHLFFCRIRPSPAVSGRFRPHSTHNLRVLSTKCRQIVDKCEVLRSIPPSSQGPERKSKSGIS